MIKDKMIKRQKENIISVLDDTDDVSDGQGECDVDMVQSDEKFTALDHLGKSFEASGQQSEGLRDALGLQVNVSL